MGQWLRNRGVWWRGGRQNAFFQIGHHPSVGLALDGSQDGGPGGLTIVLRFDRAHGFFADESAVDQDLLHGAGRRLDAAQGRDELFLFVGGLGHALTDDQPTVDLDRGLGVIGLLEAT